MSTPLGCPECKRADDLESVEEMTVHYEVTDLRREDDGSVAFDYNGESRTFDETAQPTGCFWCRHCDMEFEEAQLVPIEQDEDDEDEFTQL